MAQFILIGAIGVGGIIRCQPEATDAAAAFVIKGKIVGEGRAAGGTEEIGFKGFRGGKAGSANGDAGEAG
ncbi:MAG: hypothetical protein ABI693_11510 [Bryobacteraceae bacterium]